MNEKYLNIDIEDPRSGKIAEVLSNKTAKKILSLLAENEMSASEISDRLDLPLNTITYNMEKLVSSGLVDEVKGFLWSVKGKRIKKYKVSNRKIIISPRKAFYGILPAALISGVIAGAIKIWMNYSSMSVTRDSAEILVESEPAGGALYASAPNLAKSAGTAFGSSIFSGILVWVLGGIALGALICFIWRYTQKRKDERRLMR